MIAFPKAIEEFLNIYNTIYKFGSNGNCHSKFSDEVIKLCMNLLQQKLMQDKEDIQVALIADFLYNCMVYKTMKVDDYLICIEIVLNSTAFFINDTKIECFTTICLHKLDEIPMKLRKRTAAVKNLLIYFRDKKIEQVRTIFIEEF